MDVVAYGGLVMDLILQIDHALEKNASCYVNQLSWQYGGKVATGIVATQRLWGKGCGIAGSVGGATGRWIKHDFDRHGVDTSHIIWDPDGTSQFCVGIAISESQSRNFYIQQQSTPYLMPEQVDAAYIKSAKYLFLSDPRPYSLRAAQIAQQSGVKVVYDADKYYEEGMPEILRYVDYLIPSEMCYRTLFTDGTNWQNHLYKLQEMAAPGAVVIVTFGEKGLKGLDADGVFEQDAFCVPVCDTTGAGDVFHGAFIAGLLRQMDVRQAARYASAAAAIKCTRIGGRAGIPTHEVVERFLATGEIDGRELDERVAYYAQMPMML